jgi:CRP-like cAMP-binding protein
MTRRDIGSCLGLSLETVSRNLPLFQELGLIAVDKRQRTVQELPGFTHLFALRRR